MVKSKTSMFKGYYSFNSLIENVYYLAKWNPKEAMSWLDEARSLINSEIRLERYNKVVEQVNYFLDQFEKKPYYDKKEVWGAFLEERAPYAFEINGDY